MRGKSAWARGLEKDVLTSRHGRQSDGTDLPIDRSSYNVSVSTRLLAQPRPTANHPTSTSAQELRAAASAAVHQVAAQLKGIVDLTRIE